MADTRNRMRRWAASLTLTVLPMAGLALAPTSLAQDNCTMDPNASPLCPQAGWTQPGDLVIPATGGPPQVAVAPAPPGAPVVTAEGGDPIIPAAPPIP
ncbi:MAG: hypothetical protein K0U80_11280 [Actinomycetia bacterium]|nr:hypothetical protein [Actinomycetes bacterium]MCH9759027.1 hypothetical protein [Actinomycetes bacterium]